MISVVILTLNEEGNLPRCLASLSQCDDIVVLDSGSTDRTADIAREHGARVFTNRFENFAQQRNFAHEKIPFRHPWLLHLDADEQMTPELWGECCEIAQKDLGPPGGTASATRRPPPDSPAIYDGYYVAPRMIFRGRWIPHCTDYPSYQARLVHAARFRFIQVGHGQREAPGLRIGTLRASYLHDLSAAPEPHWLAKHRRYAAGEVATHLAQRRSAPPPRLRDLLSRDRLTRRRTLQRFAFHLPFRPQLRFVYQYILRRGFLDGLPGLRYCRLLMHYERFIVEALREAKAKR
ncbi:hypothetical protein AXK11_04240 [Cephaloticoccus primus]|uniref:Glycosyltransferase 2-like domain-containing protein n=1 Tax=Cephaloticoccus primus TaxID=1548207 RepID=A0A139SPT7_9BACT|nr:glycosyltransferase family 2 protein [Cephaloticoccus primus]KXU36566.1 hypothetical protein AXK11_04240 [Cephaloticoccus primus]